METITIKLKNRQEFSILEKLLSAFDFSFVEEKNNEITNPEIIARIEAIKKNRQKNTVPIDTSNIWESILS
jgi:hypothetical protein